MSDMKKVEPNGSMYLAFSASIIIGHFAEFRTIFDMTSGTIVSPEKFTEIQTLLIATSFVFDSLWSEPK